ncbi:esterase/lipase family protein [Phenylobacterium sp.]|jgi:hypothetical protein|uniref:esterase/lipase family protein n=1 Tax=Phenylobacterium sp. TaxID=1871053 RepID=UPI0037C7DE33
MDEEWLRRPQNGVAVIFVHGVLSSGKASWGADHGSYWPKLLLDDDATKAFGIYVFSYRTNLFSGGYRLGDAVDALKEQMRLDGLFDCHTLVFVAHSMGGIVVRKLVVERASDFRDSGITIGLFLIASPSLGSQYANFLQPLARAIGHSQADALRFSQDNGWLLDLDKEFSNLKASGDLPMVGKELVEDRFIAMKSLLRRQVVEPFSGARYFGEPFKVPNSDHFTIAAPESARAIQHRLLSRFLKNLPRVTHAAGASSVQPGAPSSACHLVSRVNDLPPTVSPSETQPGAYLSKFGYEHDIYISCAPGGVGHLAQPLRNWSLQFREQLAGTLDYLGVKPLNIVLDDSPHGTDPAQPETVSDHLSKVLARSAMLQVHVSNQFLASERCHLELSLWDKAAAERLGSPDSRISVIRLLEMAGRKWPEPLEPGGVQLLGASFHDKGAEAPWGFGEDWKGAAPNPLFARALFSHAGFIRNRLNTLRDELEMLQAQKVATAIQANGKLRQVYLHGRPEHSDAWARAAEDLDKAGILFQPLAGPEDDPDDPKAAHRFVRKASRCEAMLLVGADDDTLDIDIDLIGSDRRELIFSGFGRYLPCAVVDMAGLGNPLFIRAAQRRDIGWIDGSQPKWPSQFQAWLSQTAGRTADQYGVEHPPHDS